MNIWFHFTKTEDSMSLTVFDVVVIWPRKLIGLIEMSEAKTILIRKPAAGKLIPYIWIKNIFGIKERSFSYTQEMAEEFEVSDINYAKDTPVQVEKNHLYEIHYRKARAKKTFTRAPSKKPEYFDVYAVDKVFYRGEQVLESVDWIPMYNVKGEESSMIDTCILLMEIIEGVKEERLTTTGKLT